MKKLFTCLLLLFVYTAGMSQQIPIKENQRESVVIQTTSASIYGTQAVNNIKDISSPAVNVVSPGSGKTPLSYSNIAEIKNAPANSNPSPNPINPLAPAQGGDDIATAFVLSGALPITDAGTTTGYINDYDEVCPYTGSTAPDVVYAYTPAANVTVDIDLCGSSYDTKLYVYENTYTPGTPFACNDDFYTASGDPCGQWVSKIAGANLVGGNTYYIVIDGYSGSDYGAYILTITGFIPPPPCVWGVDILCPAGATPESEACGTDANGGCNMPAGSRVWEPVPPTGGTICGTTWANGGSRDTDWFELVLTSASTITLTANSDRLIVYGQIAGTFPTGAPDCALTTGILPNNYAGPCSETTLALGVFSPGTYWFFVGMTVYDLFPCTNNYYIDFDVVPVTCPPPTALNVTSFTTTSADLAWTAGGSETTWNVEVGLPGFTPGTATSVFQATVTNPYVTASPLVPFTSYQFYVQADCGTGLSIWAGPFNFRTGYCIPAPTSVDGLGITNVTFSTVNNTTVAEPGNYGDYSALIGDVQQTVTVPVAITFQTGYTYDTKIWIDWNDDLDFNDVGEEVYSGTSLSTNPTTLAASFTVPAGATLGNHRMRIGGVDTGPPTPCYTGSYGSFEDYTINVVGPPSCIQPTYLTASVQSTTDVLLSWTPGSPSGNWIVEWGVMGFTLGTGTTVIVSVTPSTLLTGLTPGALYDFYVRTDCGEGDLSGWAGPKTFRPHFFDCPAGSIAEAEACGDDSNGGCNAVPEAFEAISLGQNVCGTSFYDATIRDTDWFTFTLAQTTYVTLSGSADFDLLIGFIASPCPAVSFIASATSVLGATATVSTVLAAGTYYAYVAPQFTGVFACGGADRYQVTLTGSTCVAPTALTATNITGISADLGWTPGSSETAWEYVIGLSPLPPPAGAGTPTTSNPTSVSGLSGASSYSFYVRSSCGGTFSIWAGPYTFSTPCSTLGIPYSQNFDGAVAPAIPICMTVTNNNADAYQWVTSTSYPRSAPNSMYMRYNSSLAMDDWFFTPGLDLVAGKSYDVKFWYRSSSSYVEKMEVKWGTAPNAAGMTGGVIFDNPSILSSTFLQGTGLISVATTGVYYIGWHGYSDADMYYLVVDDITVTEVCSIPTTLTATNITENSADLGWTETGPATLWDLEWGPAGFPPGSGTMVYGVTNPYNLGGLSANSDYEFRVRADCGGGNTSDFSTIFGFTTTPPFDLTVQDIDVTGVVCWDATNFITVAGGGHYFTVQSGGDALFIAGVKISFMPGTTVLPGGQMVGRISTGTYCTGFKSLTLPASVTDQEKVLFSLEQNNFTIYPNPTNGNFTLVQKGEREYGNVRVDVYGMRGDKVLSTQMIGEKMHEFVTSTLPTGIYFVKIVADDYTETIKLIKTR